MCQKHITHLAFGDKRNTFQWAFWSAEEAVHRIKCCIWMVCGFHVCTVALLPNKTHLFGTLLVYILQLSYQFSFFNSAKVGSTMHGTTLHYI
jgi:hypothetical protein